MKRRVFENQLPPDDPPEPECPDCGAYLTTGNGDNPVFICHECATFFSADDLAQARIYDEQCGWNV